MRNGNPDVSNEMKAISSVLILPMRNGNNNTPLSKPSPFLSSYPTYEEWKLLSHLLSLLLLLRSYPTYEEWKRTKSKENNIIQSSVLILPMRNGNYIDAYNLLIWWGFLSYLWGMETKRPFSLYFFSVMVLILPMRNGNLSRELWRRWSFPVLILPMRNGNNEYHIWRKLANRVLILPMRNGNLVILLIINS